MTLEPLTFLGADDDDSTADNVALLRAMETSSRKRLGLLHYRSEKTRCYKFI